MVTDSIARANLFPSEKPEALPLLFQSGEISEGTESREAGCETEYWTKPYEVPDTD